MTFSVLREPFGSPLHGGEFGFGGPRMMKGARMLGREAAPMAMSAAPADAFAADGMERQNDRAARDVADDSMKAGGPGDPAAPSAAAVPPPPRKNLVETAFFLPTITSDKEGKAFSWTNALKRGPRLRSSSET
jgi:hypothetical protein